MSVAWEIVDPFEGGTRPAEAYSWYPLPPVNRYYKRRGKPFRLSICDVLGEVRPKGETDYYTLGDTLMSAKESRAFLEERLTRFRALHGRVRRYAPKECFFDLPPHIEEQ
jgi:hypothetical protein